jgi:Family of unknown function (DUF6356)
MGYYPIILTKWRNLWEHFSIDLEHILMEDGTTRKSQMTALSHLFTGHPKAAGETYFEHMAFALRFSGRLFKAALAALVHGFVPGICETTASQSVLKMNDELRARRALLTSVPGSTAISR